MRENAQLNEHLNMRITHLLRKLSVLSLFGNSGLFNFVPQANWDPLGAFACCMLEGLWKETKNT
jgi:hypothetical protein